MKRTGEALYEFLKESGYLARLAAVASSKDERKVANIARFFEIVRGFSLVAENDTIPAFVARFDLLREAGEDPVAIEVQEGDAVNIMTVHKDKGLEFRAVFVASCVDQNSTFPECVGNSSAWPSSTLIGRCGPTTTPLRFISASVRPVPARRASRYSSTLVHG